MSDRPVAEASIYTKHNIRDKHSSPLRNSNLRSHQPSGRSLHLRPHGHWDRLSYFILFYDPNYNIFLTEQHILCDPILFDSHVTYLITYELISQRKISRNDRGPFARQFQCLPRSHSSGCSSRLSVTAEARIRSLAIPRGICGGQSDRFFS